MVCCFVFVCLCDSALTVLYEFYVVYACAMFVLIVRLISFALFRQWCVGLFALVYGCLLFVKVVDVRLRDS